MGSITSEAVSYQQNGVTKAPYLLPQGCEDPVLDQGALVLVTNSDYRAQQRGTALITQKMPWIQSHRSKSAVVHTSHLSDSDFCLPA